MASTDDDTIRRIRQRHRDRMVSLADGHPPASWQQLCEQAAVDTEALLELLERQSADNLRLSRLVADITTIVATARERQERSVAEAIESSIASSDVDDESTRH